MFAPGVHNDGPRRHLAPPTISPPSTCFYGDGTIPTGGSGGGGGGGLVAPVA